MSHIVHDDDDLRHLYLLLDLGFANIRGMIQEGVLGKSNDLDQLDKYEYLEFLAKYGARHASLSSAPLKGLYDLVFAYENGDTTRPNFAVGAAIRSMLRIVLNYRGSIFWKMQAGMGDTVFTPLHQVLEKRGVKFAFFHRVNNLGLAQNEDAIETIEIGRQATVTKGPYAYDPYVPVERLDCWPSVPNYDQLAEGEALKTREINLESFWTA